MKRLILLAGLPGTGKSTFAKSHFGKDVVIISSDEIRLKYTGSYAKMLDDMSVVYQEMCDIANKIFKEREDVDVVLDTTMLNDARRNFFLDRIKGQDSTILYMLKVKDLNIILERNKKRSKDKWVPEATIHSMYERYSAPSEENKSRYTAIFEVFVD